MILIGFYQWKFNCLYTAYNSIFLTTFAADIKKEINKDVIKNKEMPYLTIEKKAKIFADFGGKATNTGSIEGQIALLTERINHISDHLKVKQKRFLFSERFDEDGRSTQTPSYLSQQTQSYRLQGFD